jgi:O-antigen/teichoic acid export membrane protein
LAAGDRITLRTLTERSFAYICLLGIPISAGLLVFAPEIMILFSGAGFEGAVPAMQISAALAILIGLGHLFGLQLLIPGGYEKKYLLATLAGMAVSLTINLLLIPVWKERGAALAMVISEVMVTGVSFWFVNRIFSLRFNWTPILKSLATCLVFIPVALLLRETIDGLLLRLIIAVLACAGLYFLIQVAVFRDRHLREAALLVTDNWLR